MESRNKDPEFWELHYNIYKSSMLVFDSKSD